MVLFKTHINFFYGLRRQIVFSANSAVPAVESPLSNRCCRYAGIVLRNGCQLANRVTDVWGESVIQGTLRNNQRSEQDLCVCAL